MSTNQKKKGEQIRGKLPRFDKNQGSFPIVLHTKRKVSTHHFVTMHSYNTPPVPDTVHSIFRLLLKVFDVFPPLQSAHFQAQ